MSNQTTETSDEVKKIAEIIKSIKFAMLTTASEDGSLRSRPMATQQVEFDGDLWFFTREDSGKVSEAEQRHEVNVSFADPDKGKYVSTSGEAEIVKDREKMKELWKPIFKTFFPQGLEDPELALLKVNVRQAEYWDSASTSIGRAIDFAKAYIKKDASELGEHAKVALK
jgi:general stress protein 26